MIQFLAGAVTLAHLLAAMFFLRFWRKTSDRLFINFASAFLLFALNQLVVSGFGTADERYNFAYLLRILGFVVILLAIVDKNILSLQKRK